jgi:hypothetical protein
VRDPLGGGSGEVGILNSMVFGAVSHVLCVLKYDAEVTGERRKK